MLMLTLFYTSKYNSKNSDVMKPAKSIQTRKDMKFLLVSATLSASHLINLA